MFKIETYKLKDQTIVFDYPELFIYKEPLIKGTDVLINSLNNNNEKAIITFSDKKFKENDAILHYHHSEDDGDYYIDQISNQMCYLCPMLYKFFKKRPNRIFVKIKSK